MSLSIFFLPITSGRVTHSRFVRERAEIDVTKGGSYTAYCVQHSTLKLQLEHVHRNKYTHIKRRYLKYTHAWNLVLTGMKATLGSSYPMCGQEGSAAGVFLPHARGICCMLSKFGWQGEFAPADTFQPKLWECQQEKHHDKCSWMGLKQLHAIPKGRIKS